MSLKYGAFYDEVAAAKDVRVSDDLPDGSVGGDLALSMDERRRQTLRWLKIVFVGSLVLLIFQLLIGWLATAITLLADAAHSGSDVISYAINWLVEWSKSMPGKRKEVSAQKAAKTVDMIDTAGCVTSVVMLFFATWWAASEAWEELQAPSEGSGHIGSALLLFAIFSSILNIGMLQMRPRQKKQIVKDKAKAGGETSEVSPTPIGWPTSDPDFAEYSDTIFCQPCSPLESEAGVGVAPSPTTIETEDTGLSLHMIFHPGCNCAAGKAPWCPSEVTLNVEEEESQPAAHKFRDLNMTAARLHLFSDMVRNILILVVGVLLQLGILKDQKYADAVCSLIVAVLILIGSLALVLRVTGRLTRCCRRKATSSATGTENTSGDKIAQPDVELATKMAVQESV
eukprot:TRINITY_DN24053_c0_g1_i1.p1 TRINITY_DN24053_c0_g1~~TRINITY_DN24053_c0_g1_i1.p1  ORF type:complete len:412 (+),score=56.84 TRINITY_DN24053_c0_g1_i1:44-1237(+)